MRRLSSALIFTGLIATGCAPAVPGGGDPKDDPSDMTDINDALAALPEAEVLSTADDGMPTYIVGDLAKVSAMQTDDAAVADTALRPALPKVLAVFRLHTDDLQLRRMNVDETGGRHFRYTQTFNGLPVVGGDLVVHVDVKGAVHAVNGTARGDIPTSLGANGISQSAAMSTITADARYRSATASGVRPVYIQTADGQMHKAFEATLEGTRAGDPFKDRVFVDVDSNAIVAVHPTIHYAKNRQIYSANNGTTLPGTVKRTEGQAANADATVNLSYQHAGDVYDAYSTILGRDSFDNAGATLINTVHYSTNYCNAFWNGTQMVYGDGNAAQGCASLANSLDVTGHEMTHAVTERESGLIYSGESGGLNESYSDIFGAWVEAWVDGGRNGTLSLANDVFLIGDEVLPPALRYMCDPATDGVSRDIYSSTLGSVDVHYSSGPNNLAFCLMSKGGTHPRGKTTVNVPAIGMDKAIRIFYKAQTDLLTANSNYAAMRTAMTQAALTLYDQATADKVGCAYAAIAVGTAPTSCGGTPPPPPPTDGVLVNNTPQTGVSDSVVGNFKFWKIDVPASQTSLKITIAGGTGDADLYLQATNKPTLTSYVCRPYVSGNSETCTITNPAAGTYWVGLNAYTAYSGVTLTGSFTGGTTPPPGDTVLTSGVPVTGLAGASGSAQYFHIVVAPNKTVTVKINGGTGDADLYTRAGSRPTTTTYACRPYLNGNTETCTASSGTAGIDEFVMVRGFSAFTGVTLTATVQ
jgi:vibriolysin